MSYKFCIAVLGEGRRTDEIRQFFEISGYQVLTEASLNPHGVLPDAFILDPMVEGGKGFLGIAQVREHFRSPVLCIIDDGNDVQALTALSAGADDYIFRNVSPYILELRLSALMNRGRRRLRPQSLQNTSSSLGAKRVLVDHNAHRFEVDGTLIDLSPDEWRILTYLHDHEGQIVPRDALPRILENREYPVGSRSFDNHIRRIRAKLPDPRLIRTIRGSGYAFDECA
ncbi:MAG: response regulator transcription factor [Spirochaetales bacterium]|nr:response regulator transcription factor [Spirochaetales bacterium]